MWRLSRSSRLMLWAVALAVLTVRASDTHMHLCFDGQQSPASVHVADASVHGDDDHDADGHHTDDHHTGDHKADKDLDPFVGLLLKSAGTDPDVALPASVVALVLVLPPPRDAAPVPSDPVPLATGPAFHLRPPLRGPPV